ncbi:hypothetical protein V8E36_009191 [Tilletia maclaganii]
MPTAHKHAQELYKYEHNAEARNKLVGRQLHRIIEKAAALCQQTGTAMFVGFAHLEHGRYEHKDVVWASPNLCDPANKSLRAMTQEMHDNFITETSTHREAGRALRAEELRAHQSWIAEQIAWKHKQTALEAENRALRQRLQQSSSSSSHAPPASALSVPSSAAFTSGNVTVSTPPSFPITANRSPEDDLSELPEV